MSLGYCKIRLSTTSLAVQVEFIPGKLNVTVVAPDDNQQKGAHELQKGYMYTLAQILSAWTAAYGEDMHEEYPGFIQRLQEEKNDDKK